jgi:hypothetical protein
MKFIYLILVLLLLLPAVRAADYQGDFELSKNSVQLGDQFTFSGDILFNGTKLHQGSVKIIFNYGSVDYKAFSSLSDGKFSTNNIFGYMPSGDPMPSGEYSVDVILLDPFENEEHIFSNIAVIMVSNQLAIESELDKEELYPGDRLIVGGSVERVVGGDISEGEFTITLDGESFTEELAGSKFSYKLKLADNIKSGYHEVQVEIKDEFGNSGSEIKSFYVNSIPSKLEIELEKNEFAPREEVKFKVGLYDQANDPIYENASVDIYEGNNKIFEKVIESNEFVT